MRSPPHKCHMKELLQLLTCLHSWWDGLQYSPGVPCCSRFASDPTYVIVTASSLHAQVLGTQSHEGCSRLSRHRRQPRDSCGEGDADGEAALLTDGCAVLDAADESYEVEYRLRRMGSAQQWHIVAGRTV